MLTSPKVSIGQKIIHAISLFSVFFASSIVGLSFLEYAQHPYLRRLETAFSSPTEKKETPKYDKFGGYKKVSIEPTGHWTIGEYMGRKTLFDPLGNSFVVMGINKVRRGNIDSASYWATYRGRESAWAKDEALFLNSLSLNTIGNRSEHTELQKRGVLRMPYQILGDFMIDPEAEKRDFEDYPDPWSLDFITYVNEEVERIKAVHGNDEYFTLMSGANETNINLRLPDGSENAWAKWWKALIKPDLGHVDAQNQWESLMEQRYHGDIGALNLVYGTSLTSFDELSDIGLDLFDRFDALDDGEEEDFQTAYGDVVAWNALFYSEYHKVIYQTAKAAMPSLLISSDNYRNGIVDRPILEAISPWIDVVSLNYYISAEQGVPSDDYINYYSEATGGKPVLISEFSYLQTPCNDVYPEVATQAERGTKYIEYRDGSLKNPNVIGVTWNELYDAPGSSEFPEAEGCTYANFGLKSRQMIVYDEMISAAQEVGKDYNEVKWSPVVGSDSDQKVKNPTPTGSDVEKELGPVPLNPIGSEISKKIYFPISPNGSEVAEIPEPEVITGIFTFNAAMMDQSTHILY